MVDLRDYQKEAVKTILDYWKEHKSALLVQATGTGKTIVFADIAKRIIEAGGRVLILAHRDELIAQAVDKLKRTQGLIPGIEKAAQRADKESVIVASVSSLSKERRLNRFPKDYFTHIVIDEAHHAAAAQYQRILKYFNEAKILGVTATPYRGDNKSLAEIFDNITYEYTLIQAITDNYLAQIFFKLIPLEINLNSVSQSLGDFKESELGDTLVPYFEAIASIMEAECKDRKTVVFLPLIRTSVLFTKVLKKHGFKAVEINGKTKNRKEILQAFEAGEIDVLCNSMLLTEGWDCPPVDCIINLRPTRSKTLYVQILGRGTRIAPGKDNLLVLDFLWQSEKYDICKPSVLIAESDEIEEKLNEILSSGELVDLAEAESQAERDVQREREDTLKKQLLEAKDKKKKLVNPIHFALSIDASDIVHYNPQFQWEKVPPTQKQIEALENNGINTEEIKSKGYASVLINRIIKRSKMGLATPKQVNYLKRKGYKNIYLWTKKEAGEVISLISANHWRIPSFLAPDNYLPERLRV